MLDTGSDNAIQEKRVFVWVLVAVSVAFIWLLLPFAGPILWATILALLSRPIFLRLRHRLGRYPNLVSVLTLLIAVVVVILPVSVVLTSVVNEAVALYGRFESGELSMERYVGRIRDAFPMVQQQAEALGVDWAELREQARGVISSAANFLAKHSVTIGQNTMSFFLNTALMLYLAFFFLRDGHRIVDWLRVAFPLKDSRETQLFQKFTEVVRATVKGNLVVGLVQGTLGGLIFWTLGVEPALLWGAVMAVSSLIPAVGTALVWLPVAIYLGAAGEYLKSIILVTFGFLVIGVVDNVLRPILVGRDTKLPDYVVLFTTLGGLALFGLHGFVLGPLLAALFFTLWAMFIREFNPAKSADLESGDEDKTEQPVGSGQ